MVSPALVGTGKAGLFPRHPILPIRMARIENGEFASWFRSPCFGITGREAPLEGNRHHAATGLSRTLPPRARARHGR
jgi:hypothetical protein